MMQFIRSPEVPIFNQPPKRPLFYGDADLADHRPHLVMCSSCVSFVISWIKAITPFRGVTTFRVGQNGGVGSTSPLLTAFAFGAL